MDMYSAVDGVPGEFHLVHLGSKALGGAGLVMTEMVCVSPEGRITPGCTGLWTDEQRDSWARVIDFVHDHSSTARIGLQLGHSGRKGSTKLMWEGMDEPLTDGQLGGHRAVGPPLRRGLPRPARDDPSRHGRGASPTSSTQPAVASRPASTCSSCTARTATCCRRSCPRSPTVRTDEYGGSLENRLRFPLEVFDAVSAPPGRQTGR